MTGDAFLSLWTNAVLVDLKGKVAEISTRLGGKPHKVTVRDICNNAVDAYKELYKEYYQNVNH